MLNNIPRVEITTTFIQRNLKKLISAGNFTNHCIASPPLSQRFSAIRVKAVKLQMADLILSRCFIRWRIGPPASGGCADLSIRFCSDLTAKK
jgi:hypothetical protein